MLKIAVGIAPPGVLPCSCIIECFLNPRPKSSQCFLALSQSTDIRSLPLAGSSARSCMMHLHCSIMSVFS